MLEEIEEEEEEAVYSKQKSSSRGKKLPLGYKELARLQSLYFLLCAPRAWQQYGAWRIKNRLIYMLWELQLLLGFLFLRRSRTQITSWNIYIYNLLLVVGK
jgi:hypothetical protein